MNWAELQENWTAVVDLIVLHFSHTDHAELRGLDGDLTSLARYLADVQDLTFTEAVEAVDFIMLLDRNLPQRTAQAA